MSAKLITWRLAKRAARIDFPAIVERHDADAEETEGEAE